MQVVVRFWLCAIRSDALFCKTFTTYHFGYIGIEHPSLIMLVIDISNFIDGIDRSGNKCCRVIRVPIVEAENVSIFPLFVCFITVFILKNADIINVKLLNFPVLEHETFAYTPFTEPCNSEFARIITLHSLKYCSVGIVKKLVAFVVGCISVNVIVFFIKEPTFQPMMLVPGVEGNRCLFKERFGYATTRYR